MEAKKLDFSRETVRVMDALDELQSALESLGEAMVDQGVLNGDLGIVAGAIDCGITDGAGFWYQVDNVESLTDGTGFGTFQKLQMIVIKTLKRRGCDNDRCKGRKASDTQKTGI